ncbi:MAG: membrane protein insertase YidC [Chloroflexi bacterium]|nr:MAG: membrane protein insertase YidC [Chloroflexota bacterium]
MRVNQLKLITGPLIGLVIVTALFVSQTVFAAPPADNPPAIGNVAQESGVSLEKKAALDVALLGQSVTYTLTINNAGSDAVSAELTDELPDQVDELSLQTDTITATSGTTSFANNTVFWSGTVEPGQDVIITYLAIPPSTSSAGQTLENTAILEFNGTSLQASATITTEAPSLGIWGGFINFIAKALVFFDKGLAAIGIPYAFGFAIILFTLLVRGATFPLNMQQIKSSKAMQELQPQLKALQEKHKNDKEKLAQAQMALYKEAGVNPLGGCLPMLVQMPIWFALYRALIHLSSEGLLDEGFFWIPSLAGPVSTWGGGIGWLWPLPPSIGWPDAIAYLIMPVLLVVSQLYMQKLMTPPSSDPQQAQMQSIMKFMPLMFGYFALIVPSGLTLYWFTSNILGVAQHYFTKTQIGEKPATAGAALSGSGASASVSAAPVAATTGENKKKQDGKSKRKSRRKR